MEQTLDKSRELRVSVTVLYTEQKVDHERSSLLALFTKNRPQFFHADFNKIYFGDVMWPLSFPAILPVIIGVISSLP